MSGYATRGAYARTRPIAVVEDLRDLKGPTSGVVRLPRRLDWSPVADYDLADPGQVLWMYNYVLGAALLEDDLREFLDERTLRRLWPALSLSPQVRQAWENQFPELAA